MPKFKVVYQLQDPNRVSSLPVRETVEAETLEEVFDTVDAKLEKRTFRLLGSRISLLVQSSQVLYVHVTELKEGAKTGTRRGVPLVPL